ncbi:MAG: hypothetical protein Q7K57_50570 [Burkholderiaceae bacterium]|nr:hypothetical protein [Burkholderiaceae bacterium]
MKNARWFMVLAAGALSLSAQAGSIYLCKAYGGGTFWSKAHCNQHKALIERIVSVPDSLPFDQQVALGEQQRAATTSSTTTTTTVNRTVINNNTGTDRQAECKALDVQIQQYDAMARQPQSGQMQDWISAQRKSARDRQFQIKC